MNIDELKRKLSFLGKKENLSTTVYFLLRNEKREYLLRCADIEDALNKKLSEIFAENLLDVINKEGLSIKDYSQADARDNVIFEFDLLEQPEEFNCIETCSKDTLYQFECFNFSKDGDLHKIFGIIATVEENGVPENSITVFRKQMSIEVLSQGKKLYIFPDDTRLSLLSTPIISINGAIDLFMYGGKFFLINLKMLERFFGLNNVIIKQAKSCLARVDSLNLVEDITPLYEAVTNVSFAKKMIKAVPNSPVLYLNPDDVIAFSKTHPFLKGNIKLSKDQKKFDLRNKKSQLFFIKLLNDDYLQSNLTKLFYDSLAKDQLKIENA